MWNHEIIESWDQEIKESRNQGIKESSNQEIKKSRIGIHILDEKYVNHGHGHKIIVD